MSGTPEWLDLTTQVFHQWQCDHFGHINTRAYAAAFDDAIFLFWSRLGGREAGQPVPVTAEMKTAFASEAEAGTVFGIRARVMRTGGKSVTLRLEMSDAGQGTPFASCEVIEVFFDLETRASAAIPQAIRSRLTALCEAGNA